ncbi:hypothetical protein N665_0279s0025 [Sinapis alba]|nr:hypothetical protein N665_0279s0025 [Sinapis alba]
MDFHSLLRRDLQFLCKRNKIPANMTNLTMADALKSLEIVEGVDEYMNQKDSNVLQSPTSVAKLPPSTATRTTRRKTTAMKAEPESSLVSRSCRLTSKSLLHIEMDQENVTEDASKANNAKFEAKTPAARKASCSIKVQESKKGGLVQSAYSTRRSTRLLEKCMADLSLITKETEQKVSAKEKNLDGSEEDEVIPGRDLSASMEKEWEMLESDSDQVTGGLEISVEKTETIEVMSDEKESANSLLQVDKEEETMQANEAVCEEGSKKNDNDQEIIDLANCVDLDEIPVLEHANTETSNDNKGMQRIKYTNHLSCLHIIYKNVFSFAESKNIQAFESLEQDNHLEIEQAIQENDSEPEKVNTFDEETVVDQADGDSETEPEEDDSCVDSDSISEADSNQADHQETEQAIQENDSETTVKINTFDEATTMVDQTEPEEDDSGDGTISEADSNEAVQGSDIAEEEMMILSESEGSVTAPTSPSLLVEEAKVKTAPFAAESISSQFPRPNNSAAATTPSKNSAMKLVSVDNNNNKENNMGVMVVNVVNNGEIKVEEAKKKNKKVEFDEENLKDVSMRKLVKMVKDLSIKGSNNNRTALQMLPSNNQTAE